MKRRTFLTGTTAILAGAVATLAGCGSSTGGGTGSATASGAATASGTPSASTSTGAVPAASVAGGKATLGMTYIPNIQFAPFYVGVNSGLFRQRGVEVTLRHHGANEGLFTALMAGQEDFIIAGADEMMIARSQGLDLVAISSYYREYPVVVIVPEASPAQTIADLRGKTIGLPGRYGESWYGLQVALKAAGLAESDVAIKEIGYTQQAALATNKVDAVVGYANNDAVQFALNGLATRSLPLAATVPLVSISLITTQKTLTAKPDLAKAIADGMLAAIDQIAADPDAAIDSSATQVPGLTAAAAKKSARATLDATLKIMVGADGKATGKLDPAQWSAMSAFLQAQGLTKATVDPAKALDATIAPR